MPAAARVASRAALATVMRAASRARRRAAAARLAERRGGLRASAPRCWRRSRRCRTRRCSRRARPSASASSRAPRAASASAAPCATSGMVVGVHADADVRAPTAARRSTASCGHLRDQLGARRQLAAHHAGAPASVAAARDGLRPSALPARRAAASKLSTSSADLRGHLLREALLEAVERDQAVAVAVLVAGLARRARTQRLRSLAGVRRAAGARLALAALSGSASPGAGAPGREAVQLLARDEARVGALSLPARRWRAQWRWRLRRSSSSPPPPSTIWPSSARRRTDLQHFLLLGLDFGHAHRAARLQVLAQRLGGARATCS